jgi:hypothetical protein
MEMKRTPAQLAVIFGCSEDQIGAQFSKNYNQLSEMHRKASATGRSQGGYTAEQLRQMINSTQFSK